MVDLSDDQKEFWLDISSLPLDQRGCNTCGNNTFNGCTLFSERHDAVYCEGYRRWAQLRQSTWDRVGEPKYDYWTPKTS